MISPIIKPNQSYATHNINRYHTRRVPIFLIIIKLDCYYTIHIHTFIVIYTKLLHYYKCNRNRRLNLNKTHCILHNAQPAQVRYAGHKPQNYYLSPNCSLVGCRDEKYDKWSLDICLRYWKLKIENYEGYSVWNAL